MDNFDTIGTNILLGASLSAAVTEKQTREMSARMQKIARENSRNSQELAAAIREQNILLSLNEDERKEYFRVKREREAEAERKRLEEAEAKRRYEAEQQAAREEKGSAVAFAFIILLIVVALAIAAGVMSADMNAQKSIEKPQEAVNIVDATPDNIQCQHCHSMSTKCGGQYFTAAGQKMNVTPKTKYVGTVYTHFSCEDCHHKTLYYINKKGE